MLIDNKKKYRNTIPATMADYLEKYLFGENSFDAVRRSFKVKLLDFGGM